MPDVRQPIVAPGSGDARGAGPMGADGRWRVDRSVPARFAWSALELRAAARPQPRAATLQLEVQLGERVDVPRLERAVRHAMADHPLATVRRAVMPRGWRTPQWEVAVRLDLDPVAVTSCADGELDELRDGWFATPIALDEAPLFRVLLARTPAFDALLLRAHHLAFDGIGALALLRSIGAAYTSGRPPDAVARDPFGEIARRSPAPPAARENPSGASTDARAIASATASGAERAALHKAVAAGRTAWRDVVGPTHLAPCGAGTSGPELHLELLRIDRATTTRLDARSATTTLDGLLLAALHLTVARWNERLRRATHRVVVDVACSERASNEAASLVVQLSHQRPTATTATDRADPRTMAQALSREVAADADEVPAVDDARHPDEWPCVVRREVRRRVQQLAPAPSAGLATLGRHDHEPFRTGGFIVDRLWFSPPVTMPQGLALGAVVFNGVLHLSFRSCRELWDVAASREFAAMFHRVLDDLA
jgi:NRPS condensation-like uncharacterized protein